MWQHEYSNALETLIVCQDVSSGAIINWYHDQGASGESGVSVMWACHEYSQVSCLTTELDIKSGDSLVVQLGCHFSCCGVIEDSIGTSWTKSENWRGGSREWDQWCRWSSHGLMDSQNCSSGTNFRNVHLLNVDLQSLLWPSGGCCCMAMSSLHLSLNGV